MKKTLVLVAFLLLLFSCFTLFQKVSTENFVTYKVNPTKETVSFYWKNENLNNNQLIEVHQKYFLQIMKLENKEDICKVLEHLQNIFTYSYNEYKTLLKDIVDLSKKNKMKKMNDEIYLQVFYVEKEKLIENKNKMTSKNFLKWLLV